jgi:hypothetical protein
MMTLDCADASAAVAKRNETVTPLQSLAMLNNKFTVRMAEHFAKRVERLENSPAEQIVAAWRLAFAREPRNEELLLMIDYVEQHGLANACRLIFNLNEFVFVD